MLRRIALFAFVTTVAACSPKGPDSLEPPRSFPIFEGGKFGFVNASGDVTVKTEYEYWGPVPVFDGDAAPAAGPNGSAISGRLNVDAPVSGALATTTDTPSRFWLLDGADASVSLTVSASSNEFSPSLQLYEFRNGSWQRVSSSDYGSLFYQNSGSARYPLGVLVSTRTYFSYSYPRRWKGGPFTVSLELNGKRATDLEFLSVLRFFEGRLPFRVGNRWGYLAEDGSIAVNPQFDSAGVFSDGLAGVRMKDRWGFVDREGTMVIQPSYDTVGAFSSGLAPVVVGSKCGYVEREGRFAINPSYSFCSAFSDGVAMVRDDTRWGAIDPDGKVLIAPQFEGITPFFKNHAGVKMGDKWGLVDRTGKVAVSPQYDGIFAAYEGGLWMVEMGDRYGYIDVEGKFVIGPTFDFARAFVEGVARVRVDDRWGFIQPDGKYVSGAGPMYDEVRHMTNGRAAVRMGDRWGFIDRKGEMIVPPTYDNVGNFDGDLAAVFTNGMLGYIDRSGKVVRPPAGASSSVNSAASAAASATPVEPGTDSLREPASVPAPATYALSGITHEIRMIGDERGYRFEPARLTISTGDAVRFIAVSGFPHNVTFSSSGLSADVKSQLDANFGTDRLAELTSQMYLSPNEGFTLSFANIPAGQYEFNCTPHLAMGMNGLITVRSP